MTATGNWTSTEADHEGRPLLIRARTFDGPIPADPALQMLMVMERIYPVTDGVALPSAVDQVQFDMLERELFEEGEAHGILMLVMVETGAGRVRYYAYVADPEAVMELLDEVAGADFEMELAADEDPYWAIYTQLIEGVA